MFGFRPAGPTRRETKNPRHQRRHPTKSFPKRRPSFITREHSRFLPRSVGRFPSSETVFVAPRTDAFVFPRREVVNAKGHFTRPNLYVAKKKNVRRRFCAMNSPRSLAIDLFSTNNGEKTILCWLAVSNGLPGLFTY